MSPDSRSSSSPDRSGPPSADDGSASGWGDAGWGGNEDGGLVVTALDLHYNGLRGVLPTDLARLAKLTSLCLSCNTLQGAWWFLSKSRSWFFPCVFSSSGLIGFALCSV